MNHVGYMNYVCYMSYIKVDQAHYINYVFRCFANYLLNIQLTLLYIEIKL